MQYAILCYDDQEAVMTWTEAKEAEVIGQHRAYAAKLAQQGKLGPVLRLLPTSAAMTVRSTAQQSFVVDGPFAETKEQLLGLWIVDAESAAEALEIAKIFAGHKGSGSLEVRPLLEMVSLAAVA